MSTYVPGRGPVPPSKKGLTFFNPSAHGVRFVANSVVTSERMVKEHPDTVKQFVRALLQGWEEGFRPGNEKPALEMLARFDKNTSRPILEKQLAMTRTLVKPDDTIAIGTFDKEAWKQTELIMLEQKQIKAPVNVVEQLIAF